MSLQKITIDQWLNMAASLLSQNGSKSPRLDAQLLLCKVTKLNKAALLAHGDDYLNQKNQDQLQTLLKRRINHEPMAYILENQEFYGRDFAVNSNVLIPRPETETLISEIIELANNSTDSLLDVGTGSGAIAITAKLELPKLKITATDISEEALAIAKQNAQKFGANVAFYQDDLLAKCNKKYDFIVANLPYVSPDWQRSPETDYEPAKALFAKDNGLDLIKQLIAQSRAHLTNYAYVILESDPCQHQQIIDFAKDHSLKATKTNDYCVILTNKNV